MQNDAATLYCPNDLCQAPNPQNSKFCQQCRTPLIKRYLWAVGKGIEHHKPGDILGDRYFLKSDRILLDTKPGQLPEMPDSDISETMRPYLRLVPYQLQVPQVYGLVSLAQRRSDMEILLLEQAPIYTDAVSLEGQLMPELVNIWKEATSLRQLNWLWQIAQLWQPLSTEAVASTLLEPKLLRVEGSLIRLLELHFDEAPPDLSQLGQLWLQQLVLEAKPAITEFLQKLCLDLIAGEVRGGEQLVAILDRGLAEVGRWQTRHFKIATYTDTGPSRQRNEDACYPPSGTTVVVQPSDLEALTIVCDGIGGHEGGNVASNLAIETIQEQVQQLFSLPHETLEPTTLSVSLERFTCEANDRISQRNDSEHRYGRQRMGTTLVMALAFAHELYIAHVGDSRAYWITHNGCHQITLDDDVASREVRLGYAVYRNALQQASSGSLIQALGMSSSASLHPTLQRFILDEDCIILLCSDGLSDYDRVEQCWETEILPILDGKVDIATVSTRLIQIGNTQNGHDNVTVGLIHCQIKYSEPTEAIAASLVALPPVPSTVTPETLSGATTTANTDKPAHTPPTTLQTQLLPTQSIKRSFLPSLLVTLLLSLGILGSAVLAYFYIPEVKDQVNPLIGIAPTPSPTTTPEHELSASPPSPIPSTSPSDTFAAKTFIKIKNTRKILLYRSPTPDAPKVGVLPNLAIGEIGEIITKENDTWLKLEICPTSALAKEGPTLKTSATSQNSHSSGQKPDSQHSTANSVLDKESIGKSGETGWIRQLDIQGVTSQVQASECSTQRSPSSSVKPPH